MNFRNKSLNILCYSKKFLKLDKDILPIDVLKAEKKERQKQYYKEFKKKNPNYYKEKEAKKRAENFERALLYQAKSTAKRKGIEFSLKIEDIVIPEKCPLTELVIVKSTGQGKVWANPYVFLVDTSRGYVRDNIMITCVLANHLRSCGKEQIIAFVKNISSLP